MKRRDFLKLAAVAVGASLGGIAYAGQSSVIEITTEGALIPNLPNHLRVVAISDLHAPSYYLNDDYEDLINIINKQSPDIFIVAGDVVDKAQEETLVNMFKYIEAKVSKLAVLGNWEYNAGLDLKRLRNEYEKVGVTLLVNEKIMLRGLSVVGLDDFLNGSPDYSLLNSEGSAAALLVISHCPESFDFMPLVRKNPLIVISGHTHGGQIAPFGLVLHTPEGSGPYIQGWYLNLHHLMYVMRGIGTSGIPLRIGSPPEVLVLNLHSTESIT
jgi:predicted MPP superfamily phosphohydrolase